MTAADLLAMPDDGVERWLIRGKLREKPPHYPGEKRAVRNWHHGAAMANIAAVVLGWAKARPEPRGRVYGGPA